MLVSEPDETRHLHSVTACEISRFRLDSYYMLILPHKPNHLYINVICGNEKVEKRKSWARLFVMMEANELTQPHKHSKISEQLSQLDYPYTGISQMSNGPMSWPNRLIADDKVLFQKGRRVDSALHMGASNGPQPPGEADLSILTVKAKS